jgi:MOSC domain-containing protein YiiM
MKLQVLGLFAGGVQPMPGDGRPTAIFKQPVIGRVAVGREGLQGDRQADRRVHGGPEKALHHYPQENLQRLAEAFPDIASQLQAGALGENISTRGADESAVCIGDVFALGTARVQLCQPRTPCWKIEARHGIEGMTRYIAERGICGWYYRVLAPGEVQNGDDLELIERAAAPISLRQFWDAVGLHRPSIERLTQLIDTPALNEQWRTRLVQRRGWLIQQLG